MMKNNIMSRGLQLNKYGIQSDLVHPNLEKPESPLSDTKFARNGFYSFNPETSLPDSGTEI